MRRYFVLLVILFTSMALCGMRHALVIGNSAYSEKKLENTINDARDMAAKFKELGFKTVLKTDLDLGRFESEIDDLVERIFPTDDVVLYYAGHGVQIDGINYLIPINAKITTEVQCKHRAMSCNYILEALQKAKVSIIILDACRNNPYAWSRSASRGLASMEGKAGSQYIIYSTAAGLEAEDGEGKNSPFTTAMKKHIGTPDVTVEDMMRKVIKEVESLTEYKQTPAAYGNLRDRFYFNPTDPYELEEVDLVPTEPSPHPTQAMSTAPKTVITPRQPMQIEQAKHGATLIISANCDGDVILNEQFQEKITPAAEVRIGGLEAGSYTVTLRGIVKSESKPITLGKDQELRLRFELDNDMSGFIKVEGGTYSMGCVTGSSDEKPTHPVSLGTFYMAKHELTQAEWNRIMGSNKSSSRGDKIPVDNVSWYEAILYCNLRSIKEFLIPAYSINGSTDPSRWGETPDDSNSNWLYAKFDPTANGYRLPTEADWEYAARGGIQQESYKYSGSDDLEAVAWTAANSTKQIGSVGTKQSNRLGIFDLSGNVMEWCWDWYDENYYSYSSETDPKGAISGFSRVVRGGGINTSISSNFRVSFRHYLKPETQKKGLGFRVVRSIRR